MTDVLKKKMLLCKIVIYFFIIIIHKSPSKIFDDFLMNMYIKIDNYNFYFNVGKNEITCMSILLKRIGDSKITWINNVNYIYIVLLIIIRKMYTDDNPIRNSWYA